jgi:hypothetical protein
MKEAFSGSEKRFYPRFKLEYPFEISGSDFKIISQIKDISCGGMFCQTNKFIPLHTRVNIRMHLPLVINKKRVEKKLSCQAEISRIDPPVQEAEKKYNLGIRFSDVSEADKALILKFLKQRNFSEAKELRGMFHNLKKMVDELMILEEAHPTSENFIKVLNRAIEELDAVARILDSEIDELKNLS